MCDTKESLTTFLNVDVDLRCKQGLDELLGYFGSSVVILDRTPENASIELKTTHDSLEDAILQVSELVQAFPAEGKNLWHQCNLRRINIWIHAGHEPCEARFMISSEAVARIASLQIEIALAVYPPVDDRASSNDRVLRSFTSPDGRERVLIVQRPDKAYSYRHQWLAANHDRDRLLSDTNAETPGHWGRPGSYCGIYDSQHTAEQEAFHKVPWLANRKPH